MTGFEPATSCSQSRRATKLRYIPAPIVTWLSLLLTSTLVCNYPIGSLPGVSAAQARQLSDFGISTTFDLLRQGNSVLQRQALSAKLNAHIKHINKWTALANLARIPGVGCDYCGLLLNAGVSTPQQLATMSAQRLHPQLRRLQIQLLNRADLAPDVAQVANWIRHAKQMQLRSK